MPRRHLVLLGSALALLPIPWSATNSRAHPTNEGEKDLKKGNAKKMNAIEILSGKSIGELHLGARTKDLPNRAVVNGPSVGEPFDKCLRVAEAPPASMTDALRSGNAGVRRTAIIAVGHARVRATAPAGRTSPRLPSCTRGW